jgi:hypothetical protein
LRGSSFALAKWRLHLGRFGWMRRGGPTRRWRPSFSGLRSRDGGLAAVDRALDKKIVWTADQ